MTLNYQIREMTKEDIHEVASLISNTYEVENLWPGFRYDQILSEIKFSFNEDASIILPPYMIAQIYVAILNNEIISVGCIQHSSMSDSAFELSWGTTKPEYQRKGISTQITLKRIEWAKNRKSHGFIFVSTRYPKLFEKIGFKIFLKKKDKLQSQVGSFGYFGY
jgi:N-acetylglutamate synthase-like GNAT family acetyltransferase